MNDPTRPGLTGSPIDRADQLRLNPAAVAAARADPAARFLPLADLDPCLVDNRLLWLKPGLVPDDAPALFLGLEDGAPRFTTAVRREDLPVPPVPFRAALATMAREEAGTVAAARSLIDWHARHGFCAVCGSVTQMQRGGWMRACPSCGAEHYPRTDPVVIMLAEHGGRVLLGRQANFPPGVYSALAGFCEVGESIEEAVARELHEEAGVVATGVTYVASQPWPFPSSLMIGCFAEVADDRLTLDETEISEAFWAGRDEIIDALAGRGRFKTPPDFAIAHTLMQRWVEKQA